MTRFSDLAWTVAGLRPRRAAAAALLVLLLALSVAPALHAAERIVFHQVNSTALGRALPVAVVQPAALTSDTPVLFFLHGRGRTHRSLVDSPAARAALLEATFFIVLPQGEDGWYIDSPAKPADRYQSYLEEVVAWAGHMLPVARGRERRGITGWSMGGYGAVRFAETHPGDFGFVSSIIGVLDFPRAEDLPEGQNYRVDVRRFTADAGVWAQFNPLNAVSALRGSHVTLVLATRGFERTMNENFVAALRRANITPRVHWLEGAHEFSVVERAVPLVLADARRYFESPSISR